MTSKRTVNFLLSAVAATAIALLLLASGSLIWQRTSVVQAASSSAQYQNERIVAEPDGTKIVLVRWAIGSRDNVETLRIPLAYLPIVGADANGPDPFMWQELFEAKLWDMQPAARVKIDSRAEQNLLIRGLVESSIAGRVRTEADQLQSIARTRLTMLRRNYYQTRYQLRITQKFDQFGLHRIGAVHELGNQTPVSLKDFYYVGNDPETASDFLLCTDEGVPDDPPLGKAANPGCEQWFALPAMSATVKITYRRRHLAEWRDIKRRATDLVLSWK